MKENIEEDIKRISNLIEYIENADYVDVSQCFDTEDISAIEHILSDYKRVLKENEELKQMLDERFIYVTGARTVYARLMQLNKEIIVKDDLKQRNAIKQLLKENEELKADIKEYEKTFDIFNERTYRKKYLEERRAEQPNLLFPDADEIYERYYKLKEKNDILQTNYEILRGDIQKVVEELGFPEDIILSEEFIPAINEKYIPKQVIKDKIEELENYKGLAIYKTLNFEGQTKTLKELLEKE